MKTPEEAGDEDYPQFLIREQYKNKSNQDFNAGPVTPQIVTCPVKDSHYNKQDLLKEIVCDLTGDLNEVVTKLLKFEDVPML